MKLKVLFSIVFVFLSLSKNLLSKNKDSAFFNSLEINTFKASTNKQYYQQSDQIGTSFKLNLLLYKKKNVVLSFNPILIKFSSQYFRGAFFDSINKSSDMELNLKLNAYGFSGGFEYLIGEKLSLKTEIGLTYNKLRTETVSDNFIDTNKYSYCPPSFYSIENKILKKKITYFTRLTINSKLSKRFGINIGLHYQPPIYKIINITMYEKCYNNQIQSFSLKSNATHFSIGLNYYFNL